MTFTDASCWPTLLEIKVLQWFLATANNLLLVLELAEVLWRWKKGSSDQAICFCIPTWRTTEKKVILKGSRVASGLCGTFIFKSGIYLFTRRVSGDLQLSSSPLDHFRTRNHMQESQQTYQDQMISQGGSHVTKSRNESIYNWLVPFECWQLLASYLVTLFKNKGS